MSTAPRSLIRASWVCPMNRPAIRDGGVVIERERILAVGGARELRDSHPDAMPVEIDGTLLPGLVNAHAHLELSDCACGVPPEGGFVGWLMRLMRQTVADESRLPELVGRAIASGVDQCLGFGVTTVGDISRQCHLSRPLLRNGPLRVVSYGEVQAMAQRRTFLEERLARAADESQASDRLTIGITPHAPYSVEPHGYARCLELARERRLPLATHLAETPFESEFLAGHTGPFRELWAFLNAWDDRVPVTAGGPIRFARSLGLLDYPTLLAHVNYADDEELAILAQGSASVVYCPRTHAYFGHPPHRWREMLARGINVAVGTDSCASSPDLNLVDDLRVLRNLAPDVAPEHLWEMATTRAARAVGLGGEVGSITAGKRADLVAFPANDEDPLASILDRHLRPTRLWIAGDLLVPTPRVPLRSE